uniref:Inter-alpha-trypsin inhibitor heavy chain H3 n=1 Tax=Nothobranchius furzeri TaxID=105023 RepID=A0A1A8V9U1_NOTFU
MEIEGKVYVGEVKEKEKAKKQYEKAVSTGQTAGLVKASGRKMEKFSVHVNIAAENLHEEDYFAVILFDNVVNCWKESLTKATKENVAEAMEYVKGIRDEGTTNINSAMLRGINMLVQDRQDNHLPEKSMDMIILLTDGMPNDGESNIQKIQQNEYIFGDFTERLWAYLTIQQLLEKSKSGEPDEKANATAKALDMSLQYNFVTPLTSMVIIGDKKIPPDGKINTYFWKFGIIHQIFGVKLEITTQEILVLQDGKQVKLLWTDMASLKGDNVDLLVTKDGKLTVTLKDSVKFIILLHKVWKKHPYHRDYLGIYTVDTHLLSPSVHGLLGQFYHGIDFEVTNLHPGEDPEKPDATMFVKGQEINVTRGWQRDFRRNWKGENVPCWFVHNNGLGLIDGVEADYIVSDLFTAV